MSATSGSLRKNIAVAGAAMNINTPATAVMRATAPKMPPNIPHPAAVQRLSIIRRLPYIKPATVSRHTIHKIVRMESLPEPISV